MYRPTRRRLGGWNRQKVNYSWEANKYFYSTILFIIGFLFLLGIIGSTLN